MTAPPDLRVARIDLRDFRSYERAQLDLGPSLTLVTGPNGAGKTNLLEAVYFGCTGHSPRTSNERELVRRGAELTRVAVETTSGEGQHELEVGFRPGEPKRLRVDGAPVDSLATSPARPLLGVFQPDRLTLVKGAPSGRRAHLDSLVAALWPSRVSTRSGYSRVLAQRNALLVRIRARAASAASLDSWDLELARHGTRLAGDRREACEALAPLFAARAGDLGLPGPAELRYRPRSRADDAPGLAAELLERRASDLDRGFTGHGPHRDELELLHAGESLRVYGSQGQQRMALLSLLLAERDLLREEGRGLPLMLLDDVMSELDASRRARLAELVLEGGQALVTTADPDHVPGASDSGVARIEVTPGRAERAGQAEAADVARERAAA